MIQNVMHNMAGTSAFGVFSICLFVAVFAGVLVWTVSLKKSYVRTMGELPLEGDPTTRPELEGTLNPEERHD